jgi:hypothetical protein
MDQPSPRDRTATFGVTAPTLELPTGGGALRGIGETFTANPATGTGSMAVPVATSPGRGGFGPQLSLTYDSGSGNGPFGFGWSLSLPHISRKTDRRLPEYADADESDVFVLSGVEDLVPVLNQDSSRWEDRVSQPGYVIHRYRPRIEGLFARIERWTRIADGDVHWRAISRDNVLTIYGKDARSRIADSAQAGHVFTWLICQTLDDKGNVAIYDYKPEDGAGVDLTSAHERNRGAADDARRGVNRYIKRIRYGNQTPLRNRPTIAVDDEWIGGAGWLFEVAFDYGEHHPTQPRPLDTGAWLCRQDAFSSYRAGFEVRTSRRCRRVLMFHHFASEPDVGLDCLVRSTDFTYADELSPPDPHHPAHSFLRSVTQRGYRRDTEGYIERSLPPVEFEYSVPSVQSAIQDVALDGHAAAYAFVDLHAEGMPGLLVEQGDAWYYRRNLTPAAASTVSFSPTELVATKPNASSRAQLIDLVGSGRPSLVALTRPFLGSTSTTSRKAGRASARSRRRCHVTRAIPTCASSTWTATVARTL